jgi:hypothetical protein
MSALGTTAHHVAACSRSALANIQGKFISEFYRLEIFACELWFAFVASRILVCNVIALELAALPNPARRYAFRSTADFYIWANNVLRIWTTTYTHGFLLLLEFTLFDCSGHHRFPSRRRSSRMLAVVSFSSFLIKTMCGLAGFGGTKRGHILAASEFVVRDCSAGLRWVFRSPAKWGQMLAAISRCVIVVSLV